jgi:hypothetical protein
LDLGQPTAALAHLEEAWTTARAHDDPLLGWAPANAGAMICTVYLLDPAEGRAWCRRGLGQPRFDQLAHQHDALADQLVLALATSGELEAAQRAAARLPQEAVARRLVGLLLGDWEQAATQWRSALDHDVSAGDRHDAVANARWLAEALILLGQEHQAAAVLHQGLEIAASAPQLPSEVWIRARLAGLAGTEPTQAASHLARCEEVLGSGGDWRGLVGEVALARAAVALRDTDVAGADAAAQEAVAVFASYRLPWRRAAALQVWSLALDAGGREDEAHARRDEAAALLEGIGAPQRWRTDTRRRSSTRAQRRLNT